MTDIIVIGGGTAGMTACLYALRGGKKVTLLEGEGIGGQIALSPRVENFASIKEISGAKFSENLFEQILALGCEVELDKAVKVQKNGQIFEVLGEFGQKYEAKSVVIATGVKHKTLHIQNEDKLVGKGLYYCAVCDGAFYKGKDVIVIGDANSALQYTIYLASICNKVTLLTLFDKFFADKILVDKLNTLQNLTVIQQKSVFEYLGTDKCEGVVMKDTQTGKIDSLKASAVFVAIGQEPFNKPFENIVNLDKFGYIISDETCTTKTEGLYVAGDCRTKAIRQLSTAVGDGAVAGLSASMYLDKNF